MASAATTHSPGKRSRTSPLLSSHISTISPSIVWYRDFDLRIHDHEPLAHAACHGPVIPVFFWPAKQERGHFTLGGAAQVQLYLYNALSLYLHPQPRLGSKSPSTVLATTYLALAAASSCAGERDTFTHQVSHVKSKPKFGQMK